MKQLFLLIIILTYTSSIGIPLRHNDQKCMIVYTVGQSESVKITARLPQFPNQLPQQTYEVTIKNTESDEQIVDLSLPGIYKRQLSLTPSVIYEICFKANVERDIGKVIIQYTAENLFSIQHSDIKVPDNLLKAGDFKNAYEDAQRLSSVTKKFTDLQKQRKQSQSQVFIQTTKISSRLMYISIAQIVIILVAGLYQFYSLRSYLVTKQYI